MSRPPTPPAGPCRPVRRNRRRLRALLTCAALLPALRAQESIEVPATADTSVLSKIPRGNFGGRDVLAVGNAGREDVQEAFVLLSTKLVPPTARVVGAVWNFQVTELSRVAPRIDVGRVNVRWNESTMTFLDRPVDVKDVQGVTPGGVGRQQVVANPELVATIQRWVADPASNNGLRLKVAQGSASQPGRVQIVSREGATTGRVAASLRIDFVDVRVATGSLAIRPVGEDYLSEVTATTRGVDPARLTWRVLDALPRGLDQRVVNGALQIFGRAQEVFDRDVRVQAEDPASGARAVRALRLRILPAGRVIVFNNGNPQLRGDTFDPTNPGTLVALATRVLNTSGDVARLDRFAVLVAGSVDNVRELARVELFEDRNRDSELDAGDVRVAGPQPFVTDDDFVDFALRVEIPPSSSKRFLVVIRPRPGIARGADFTVALEPQIGMRVRLVGSAVDARIGNTGPVEGGTFVAGGAPTFDGDADGDGRIDCTDLQTLARRVGSAAAGSADPDGDGTIRAIDVELARDFLLGRPVATRIDGVAQRGDRPATVVLRGFDLGTSDPRDRVQYEVDGRRLSVLLRGGRIAILNAAGLTPGSHRLVLRNDRAVSREYTFVLP